MFDSLGVFLKQKATEVANPEILVRIGNDVARDMLFAAASSGEDMTGVMHRNLTFVDTPQISGLGWSIGIGRGGDEDKAAPRGTIAQFLQDFPQFKYGMEAKERGQRRRRDEPKAGFKKTGLMAWWGLSVRARRVLAYERAKGQYGGIAGESPYYYLQEMGKPQVRIEPRRFVDFALQRLPTHVHEAMAGLFNA